MKGQRKSDNANRCLLQYLTYEPDCHVAVAPRNIRYRSRRSPKVTARLRTMNLSLSSLFAISRYIGKEYSAVVLVSARTAKIIDARAFAEKHGSAEEGAKQIDKTKRTLDNPKSAHGEK